MARFRSVCFTINNYSDADVARLEGFFDAGSVKYIIFQRETGTNGTRHLQGYCVSPNAKTTVAWRDFLGGRAHVEKTKGTPEQAKAYCSKEESRDAGTAPFERGSLPQQGKRSDLDAIYTAIQEGSDERAIVTLDPGAYFKYSAGIKRAISLFQGRRNWKTHVFWWYGSTGTGKSREASERFPEAYWKPPSTKWWDGYEGQATVIIDDHRRDLCTFAELLRLLDRYPMSVEYKGGTVQMLARNIVITTPRSPRDTWEGRTAEDIAQLERRIEETRRFGEEPEPLAMYPLFNPPPAWVVNLVDSDTDA